MTRKKVLQVALASICVAATAVGAGLLKTTKVSAETATTEWATGNSAVTATFNYDLENSAYSAWAINQTYSNAMVKNNAALEAKGFWTEESYVGLKPLVYSTTAVGSEANNSAIVLGSCDDDFTIACTLMHSYGINVYNGRADYLALQWKFTDVETGNYFSVAANGYNSDKTSLNLYYNAGITTSNRSKGKVSDSIGVCFTGKGDGVKLVNLWFDTSEKTLYFGNDLSQSVNVEEFLAVTDFPEFEEYTVELSFRGFNWNTNYQATDKNGNLAVYYLNGLETHSTTMDSLLAPATTEWATGNSSVTATLNYDLANSDYSTWAINSIDNTALLANNEEFEEKGFWTEESYTGLKPLVYSTTAVGAEANNSKIALGYYDDDFKISCTPMQRYERGSKTSYVSVDYMALQWKFTDIATGNYFNVCTHTWNTTKGIMNILYNKTTTSKNTYLNKASEDLGVAFMGKNGNNLLNLWFDGSTKTLYFGNDLSQSVNVEEFLTREKGDNAGIDTPATNFPEFEAYTVELSFTGFNWNTTYQPTDKAGNLAVYYLNGETHSKTKYTLDSTKATMYATEDSVTTTDGIVDTNGIVKAWDRIVGDVSSEVSYTVTAPDASAVTVTDGKFVATASGAYTLNASVTVNGATTTKAVTLNVAFPTGGVILKKASLNLEGKIGVQFLVSADTALYNAEGGKVVFTVADQTTEVAFADWKAYGTDYIVECKVAAKQMADTISVKFVDKNGAETATTTYSVKEYANQVLTQYADNETLVSLIKATLNYGAYAQTYFNYNVENLANAGLFEGETNPVDALTEVTAATVSVSNALTEVSLKSLSLGLETETEIYVLFTLASGVSIDDVTIKLGDATLETVEAGGNYYVVIKNVAAKNIDEVYTLTVTYGDNTATYSISAQCYISAAFTEEQTAYNDLLKAIQLYNVAANAYFA